MTRTILAVASLYLLHNLPRGWHMTLLVTGGTGLLGLHLVREHLLAGRHVTVLARTDGRLAQERVERFLAADGTIDRLPGRLRDLLAVVDVDVAHHSLGLSPLQQRALAARATGLWHAATSFVPNANGADVWRTTVSGTENVLRFATGLRPAAPVRHVSTALVGGRTRTGTFREQHSAEVVEFENAYERAEHFAEGVVRRWANRHGRGALIVRPGILVPDPRQAGVLPSHLLRVLAGAIANAVAREPARSSRHLLRFSGEPRGFLNLLQAGWAARAMLRLGERVDGPGTHAVHVVHPRDTPVRAILRAVEDVLPVRLRITPAEPADPTRAERAVHERATGLLAYLHHRRRFDGSALRDHGVDVDRPAEIERSYLRDVLAADLAAARRPTRGLAAAA
jgi:nucleoside-diphosphate-sugar epimerase